MYRVTFVSSLFTATGPHREASHATLGVYLRALTDANVILMRAKSIPLLYESGAVYRAEPIGQENWKDAARVVADRCGDCEDLAAYRAAELRVRYGVDAQAVFQFWQNPHSLEQRYHCLVLAHMPSLHEAGVKLHKSASLAVKYGKYAFVEDPSKVLGMKGSW